MKVENPAEVPWNSAPKMPCGPKSSKHGGAKAEKQKNSAKDQRPAAALQHMVVTDWLFSFVPSTRFSFSSSIQVAPCQAVPCQAKMLDSIWHVGSSGSLVQASLAGSCQFKAKGWPSACHALPCRVSCSAASVFETVLPGCKEISSRLISWEIVILYHK